MKRMGRDNARNAGNIGADPRTIMGIALLSMFIVVIGLINFGLWVSVSMTGNLQQQQRIPSVTLLIPLPENRVDSGCYLVGHRTNLNHCSAGHCWNSDL